MTESALDVICVGRAGIDLYGEQVGGRLEDMSSFAKYVGGCPTNIAVGAARLGLRSALITRVGDEQMGRFIRDTLAAEGVDIRGVATDPERLTGLVILGIRDENTFPLLFYRRDCADMALSEDDIDPRFIAEARAVVVTGTHFTEPGVDAASREAMRAGRDAGARIVFDIDFRPVLWGLTGHDAGEERFVASDSVSGHLQSILPGCDLVVGTEEELHIAGGSTDTLAAIRRIRELSAAVIVCKQGPMGCTAFPDEIPESMDGGIVVPGFPVNVFNVLGAGDSFLSGFLRGWLRDEPLETCCRYANACGAFAVSRHGCTPAIPTWAELEYFLEHGSRHADLRLDGAIEQLHWATTRRRARSRICALAFDHRTAFEDLARRNGAPRERIGAFKALIWRAARRVAGGGDDFGILVDDRHGRAVLHEAAEAGCWIARPIETPGSRPVAFEGAGDVGLELRSWPVCQVVKCLVFYHPEDPEELRAEQERRLSLLSEACRETDHELMLEIVTGRSGAPVDDMTVATVIERLYGIGIAPDWWKLEPPADDAAWSHVSEAIAAGDPYCNGVLLLGLDAPEETLLESFAPAARQAICRGFAVGRTIFGPAAEDWFAGRIDDGEAVERIGGAYGRLAGNWRRLREPTRGAAEAGGP